MQFDFICIIVRGMFLSSSTSRTILFLHGRSNGPSPSFYTTTCRNFQEAYFKRLIICLTKLIRPDYFRNGWFPCHPVYICKVKYWIRDTFPAKGVRESQKVYVWSRSASCTLFWCLMDNKYVISVAWNYRAKNPRPLCIRAGFAIFTPFLSLHPLRVMEAKLLRVHNFALGLWMWHPSTMASKVRLV